jgi:hypothetical protein
LIYTVNIVDITLKGDASAGSPHGRMTGGILLAKGFPLFAVVINSSMPARGHFFTVDQISVLFFIMGGDV